jgi:hypothetical protein
MNKTVIEYLTPLAGTAMVVRLDFKEHSNNENRRKEKKPPLLVGRLPVYLLPQKSIFVNVVTEDIYLRTAAMGLFIAPNSIVPVPILKEMWLWNEVLERGRLGGRDGRKVRPKTFDGIESVGLFYGKEFFGVTRILQRSLLWQDFWREGENVADQIGVEKGPIQWW